MLKKLAYKTASRLVSIGSPVNGLNALSILIYHQVLSEPDYLKYGDPDIKEFDWQMRLLREHCNPMSLADALAALDNGTLPPRAVCVTFDDGYADNLTNALPIFQKWSIPATVFVAPTFLDGGRMWNDTVIETVRSTDANEINLGDFGPGRYSMADKNARRQSLDQILTAIKHLDYERRLEAVEHIASHARHLPTDMMMTTAQLKQLSASDIEIGAHTMTHPILTRLSEDAARAEIVDSKQTLEQLLSREIRFFAYPNGKKGQDFDDTHAEIVRDAGFEAAVATDWGKSTAATDRFQIPRFTPWDKSEFRFFARLMR